MNRQAGTITLVLLCTALLFTPLAGARENDASSSPVTFTKDVLPILQENCQRCHRPDGASLGGMVAPMALVSYDEVRPWARSIAKQVQARNMPPWDASPAYNGVFSNERTLTEAEIDTVVSWVDSGAVRDRAEDAPEPIEFPATTAEMMFGFVRYALTQEPTETALDAETLSSYVGIYSFGGSGELHVPKRRESRDPGRGGGGIVVYLG